MDASKIQSSTASIVFQTNDTVVVEFGHDNLKETAAEFPGMACCCRQKIGMIFWFLSLLSWHYHDAMAERGVIIWIRRVGACRQKLRYLHLHQRRSPECYLKGYNKTEHKDNKKEGSFSLYTSPSHWEIIIWSHQGSSGLPFPPCVPPMLRPWFLLSRVKGVAKILCRDQGPQRIRRGETLLINYGSFGSNP